MDGLKGGPARTAKLSKQERVKAARLAARARWSKKKQFPPYMQIGNVLAHGEIEKWAFKRISLPSKPWKCGLRPANSITSIFGTARVSAETNVPGAV